MAPLPPVMANAAEDFSQFGISKEEKDKLVGELIRYMLFKTHQNSGCPIKREELTQLVTKNYHQRNLPTFVINEAKEKLSFVFGYEMRELQRAHPSSKAQTRSSQQRPVTAFLNCKQIWICFYSMNCLTTKVLNCGWGFVAFLDIADNCDHHCVVGEIRGNQSWFTYYNVLVSSFMEMSHQCQDLMMLPPAATCVAALAPPDETGLRRDCVIPSSGNLMTTNRAANRMRLEILDSEVPYRLVEPIRRHNFDVRDRALYIAVQPRGPATQLLFSGVADSKSYILISQLPPNVYEKYVVDVNTAHLSGFTFVIISIVYLAGGKIPEENLWSQMRRMGLGETEASHPVLGNVKQALELLVQQRYLQKDKVNGPEGNTVYYELAERALDGPMNDRVKEYISQIVQDNTSVGAA
ncbi:hypothetical protein JHK82_042333 [Glycine max]|uniref:MAGE domain-containing protein n=1 Tax=Glycine soja TaxID=3848 RepID=A0A445GTR9_GLYSO|nr:hypothetical protein JHK86_042376 [Glycine max]KAG4956623.1 hypothetical protein JHK85_043003 [Glycine max]KAG5105363.1 hypothetical protein JHK82_042333 [Glycine max]KAG5116490.1 hypothetical protein JHK84_042603 [Glycine max]RZB64646.1 hypothetical protein D0Y65_040934 [Glycine soja]